LYNGFLDPADSAPEPRDDVDTLVLANGDTLAGRVLGLEGGKWTVEVEGVELAVDGQNLAHLVLRSRAATAGAPPDALRVHTGTSGLTLRSVSLQGERVTGESPWGGKIAIDRQFVHRLTSLSEAAKTPEPNEGASGH
jgi:hypothetical protein